MARKSTQKRLTIPKDIWDSARFDDYSSDFGFFKVKDSRVIITHLSIVEKNKSDYEFLGKCHFDHKHRFFTPKNVDVYLGDGEDYIFSSTYPYVYIYKMNLKTLSDNQKRQLNFFFATH